MKTSSDDLHENSHMSRTLIWTILHQDSFWNFLENPRARCVDFEAFLQYLLTPKVLWTSDTSVAINGKTSGVCEGTKVARLYAAHQMGAKDKKPKMCACAPIRDHISNDSGVDPVTVIFQGSCVGHSCWLSPCQLYCSLSSSNHP